MSVYLICASRTKRRIIAQSVVKWMPSDAFVIGDGDYRPISLSLSLIGRVLRA